MKNNPSLNWTYTMRRDLNPAIVIGLFALMCLALVVWMRNSNLSTHEEPIVATHVRVLRFIDQPDGSINVIDKSNEQFVQIFRASKDSCAAHCAL
jgi:hypothetical protein